MADAEMNESNVGAAIAVLDPVVALLSLIQLTGDRSLLARYGPSLQGLQHKVKEAFVAFADEEPPSTGSLEDADEVRNLLRRVLDSGRPAVMPRIDRPLFKEMSALLLGAPLPEMSVDVAYQHGGFTNDTRVRQAQRTPSADFKVIVVGAGMMGINAAVKLQQAGFDFKVLEALDDVGGNWRTNTYPGAAVDTPSRVYSFSFDPNASWTKYYPNGPEFLSYLTRVTDKFGLRDRIQFGTWVEGSEWDEARKVWKVHTIRDGHAETLECNMLIMSVGPNNNPNFPKVKNLDAFKGPVVHSAQWDHQVDLKGKKVALVGTGCSGVQVATAIAGDVGELVIIQRQPEHIIPNPTAHAPVDAIERWQMENIPFVVQWKRLQSLASQMQDMHGMVMKDEEYAAQTGGFGPINDGMRMMCDYYLKGHFPDNPDLVEKLTPPYPVFAKRPILDCGFFDTLKKPNVKLVQGAMTEAEENAIILADGTRIECDILLLATGYNLHFGRQFDIRGKDGRALKDVFDPYPFSYEGLLIPGFPNFVFMGAPYSYLVANHAVVSEQQVHYIVELLQWMVDDQLAEIDVTAEATRAFVEDVDSNLAKTAWVQCGTAHGYYRDKGQKVILAIPRHNSRIWHDMRRPRGEDFETVVRVDAEASDVTGMPMLTI